MLIKQVRRWLPWCWLAFCVGSFLLFLHQNMLTMLEADMASEMALGYHIFQSKNLVPADWYYSTEIRLLNMPLLYAFFFQFIESWHWVRILSVACGYVFMLLAFYYLCRQLGMQKIFPVAASAFFLPLSDIYAYILLIGAQYLPYAVISFLFLSAVIHYVKTSRKSTRVLLLIALSFLALITGMTGLRMILQLILPFFITSVFLCCQEKQTVGITSRLFPLSVSLLLLTGNGYLINSRLLTRFFDYTQYNDMVFTEVHFSTVVELLNDLLNHLGYRSGDLLLSPAALRAVLCLTLLCLVIMAFCTCIKPNSKTAFSWADCLPVLTCFLGIFLMVILVAASSTHYSSNYLIPSLVFVPVIVALVLTKWNFPSSIRKPLVCVLMLLIVFCGVDTCRTYNRGDDNTELQQIAASLAQDGYTDGYSTFWRGNLVTELSDGKLDMRVWDTSDDMDISTVNPFLQLKSHETTIPQGKTFIILSKYFNEHNDIALATWLQPEDIYWDSKDYLVYGYESYDDLLNSVNQSCTRDLGGRKVAPASPASLSPIPLYPGSYTVSIAGEQLDGLQITCTHSEGSLVPVQPSLADGALTFRLQADDLLHDVQINLQNSGAQSAMLESFHLQKDSGR